MEINNIIKQVNDYEISKDSAYDQIIDILYEKGYFGADEIKEAFEIGCNIGKTKKFTGDELYKIYLHAYQLSRDLIFM